VEPLKTRLFDIRNDIITTDQEINVAALGSAIRLGFARCVLEVFISPTAFKGGFAMKYNYLPGTSVSLSQISLGTMMFGSQTNEAESLSIIDYAIDHGINFLDTANVYNRGASEQIVGKGLKGKRDKLVLATKVSLPMGEGINESGLNRRAIRRAVDASLKRLDTDYIDLYYMHAPDYQTRMEETMEAMTELVKDGKICYVGVSNYAAWQIADMVAICDRFGFVKPVVTQNVYNAITRGIETELLPFLNAHDIGLTVYNPIAGGLLAGKHKPGQPEMNTRFANNVIYLERYWSEENFAAVEQLTAIANRIGIGILELSLRWCAAQKQVTSIISGVSRLSQLEQNISSLEGEPLSAEILSKCDEVWRSLAGTGFGYNR
jgi:1-deoxyxylulose-5-phosphate synthase